VSEVENNVDRNAKRGQENGKDENVELLFLDPDFISEGRIKQSERGGKL